MISPAQSIYLYCPVFFFVGQSFLIATGSPVNDNTRATEVFALAEDPEKEVSCSNNFPAYPIGVSVATGGLLGGKTPIICGGKDAAKVRTNACYTLNQDQDQPAATLSTAKSIGRGSIVINDEELFLVGGFKTDETIADNTEFVTLGKPTSTPGPKLPFGIQRHCFLKIDESTAFVIGGRSMTDRGQVLPVSSTLFYDIKAKTFQDGPKLNHKRFFHVCARFDLGGKTFVLVAGPDKQHTEIWNPTQNKWIKGPDSPSSNVGRSAAAFTSSDGKAVFIFVSTDGSLLKFDWNVGNLRWQWTTLNRKLKTIERTDFVLMELPPELVSCDIVG